MCGLPTNCSLRGGLRPLDPHGPLRGPKYFKHISKFKKKAACGQTHDYIHQFKTGEIKTKKDLKDVAKALAVYSGFTEGLQLFSSFAILINFQRFNKMKGMCKIVDYSIRDESLHVEGMTKVFRTLIKENLDIWTDDFKKELYDICREMVEHEDKFIE